MIAPIAQDRTDDFALHDLLILKNEIDCLYERFNCGPPQRCLCGCGKLPKLNGFALDHEKHGHCNSLEDRFMKFVEQTETCWVWRGAINSSGYGSFNIDGKIYGSHRVSWRIFIGPDEGIHVLHRCDNRMCVNPDHLFSGNNSDNVADRVAKGRSAVAQGTRNPRAKITDGDVREIRHLHSLGVGTRDLSVRFGICRTAIQRIVKGTSWSHIK